MGRDHGCKSDQLSYLCKGLCLQIKTFKSVFWVCEKHQYPPKRNTTLGVPSVSILTITLSLEVHILGASTSYTGSLT